MHVTTASATRTFYRWICRTRYPPIWAAIRWPCWIRPRDGALEVVRQLSGLGIGRLVYVSCNPATLARDAGELVRQGYRMTRAGILDMFPQTAHVEAMVLFEAGRMPG